MPAERTNQETGKLDSGKKGKNLNPVFVFQGGCAARGRGHMVTATAGRSG